METFGQKKSGFWSELREKTQAKVTTCHVHGFGHISSSVNLV
jgi:hypothetical protein